MKITIHPTSPMYTKKADATKPGSVAKTVYRYIVEGTKAELADYKKVKGNFHIIDEETGQPLFFTVRYAGKSANLRRLEKENGEVDFVPNDDETRMFASLVAQYGIDVAKVIWEKDNQKAVKTNAVEKKEEE